MPSVYVTRGGSRLSVRHDRLLVEKDEVRLLDLALRRIDSVVCFGRVHVTTPALYSLLEAGIDLALVTRQGDFRGRLTAPCSKNIYLRFTQYENASNESACAELARKVVSAKVRNSRNVLLKFQYNHPSKGLASAIRKLERLTRLLESESCHPSRLRGLEGTGSRLYFGLFDQMLRCGLVFERRSIRPPRNEVNSLLSLTYVLVTAEIITLLEGMGFDPHVGFFHRPGYGRPSLALDMLEPFRSCLCDVFVLRLFNLKILGAKDFTRTEEGGYRLTDEGLKEYLEQYERRMTREFTHPQTGKRVTWRDCLRLEGEKMRRCLMRHQTFQPFESRV